jgi:dihydroflavonol-4-reductase
MRESGGLKVFVTGGNGFIGSRVVHRLCERGHAVRCLLRDDSRTDRIDDLTFERVVGDLHDRSSLERGMRDRDACIHLAGVSSWDEIAADYVEDTVVEGTRAVLDVVREAGPETRFVYVSSAAAVNGSERPEVFDETSAFALGDSGLRYAIAKHAAEELVLSAARAGLHAVVVNPTETYGPDDDEWVTAGAIRDALRGWPALAVRGGASVTHVDDVAAGIVAALEHGRAGERYILGGENLTVAQIVKTAVRRAGSRKPVVVLPASVVRAVVRLCTMLRVPPPILPDLVGYACRYWFMDSTKARAELGYRPRPAAETLASVVDWIATGGPSGRKVSA